MDDLKTIVRRIERRLGLMGLKAATASRLAGLSSSAIYNLQRGAKGKIQTKGGNASTFAKLAPVLGTTVEWLTTGLGPETPQEDADARGIPVKGYVGASAAGHLFAVAQGDFDQIDAPKITDTTTALEIMGRSLGAAFDRWYVVYDERLPSVPPDLIGKLCVVGLPDDRIVVKVVRRAGKRFDLIAEARKDDILNVMVEWIAAIKFMMPR